MSFREHICADEPMGGDGKLSTRARRGALALDLAIAYRNMANSGWLNGGAK